MRLRLIFLLFLVTQSLNAQKFDGFVITNEDSLFRGFMRISIDGQKGRKILITDDKKKAPRSFHLKDLQYYAYRGDTTAILRGFYPFEGENYHVDWLEAKVLISKGKIKLYYATFPEYKEELVTYSNGVDGMPQISKKLYSTFLVKDLQGNLVGVPNEKDKFIESIRGIVGDNKELMKRIENKELRYKHTEEIIRIFNKSLQYKPIPLTN